ncbi:MAG: DUF192 domain-containing protein [Nitrospirae bacterium]|nr:DUF192 domain-containing protein [Nitrospirota bacterium]
MSVQTLCRLAGVVLLGVGLAGGALSVAPKGASPNGASHVRLPNGAVYAVEVPQTREGQERGLMFRSRLEPRTGMLFLFSMIDQHPIWMKNCLIALDLVWLDGAKRVVAIRAETPPCAADPCPIYSSPVPSLYVLEIPAGAAKREGLTLGSLLKF